MRTSDIMGRAASRWARLSTMLPLIRYRESVIFQSPAIVGLAIFIPELSQPFLLRAALAGIGTFLIMAHIFSLNDWADLSWDHENPEKRYRTFIRSGISSREMGIFSIWLALAGITILALVSRSLIVPAALMVLFGIVYSVPIGGRRGKSIPGFSSLLHFAGTSLTFLAGAMTFAPAGAPAFLIAAYFGILITAGHLVQEVQDYAGDRHANDVTNAVRFGQTPVFVWAFVLFAGSFVYLFWLARSGLVPPILQYAPLLFPVYAVWAVRALRAGLQTESVRGLRDRYRMLFGIVVAVMLVSVVLSK